MLSRHSFNALLKTLEEPPPHVIFLLATTDPDKLPVTVLSRCLQFNLRGLTRDEISGQLEHILQAEQIPFDPAALSLLARSANGSMRDALSLTDQAIAQGNQAVREDVVAQMLGRIDAHNLLELVAAVHQGDVSKTLTMLRDLAQRVPDVAGILAELQGLLHQLALVQVAPSLLDSELIAQREQLQALAAQIPAPALQVYYRLVIEGRRELPFAVDTMSGVEMTLLRLVAFRPQIAGEQQPPGKPQASENQQAAEPAATYVADAASNQDKDPALANQASATAASTQQPAPKTEPQTVKNNEAQSSSTAERDARDDFAFGGDTDDDDDYDLMALHAAQQELEQQAQSMGATANVAQPSEQPSQQPNEQPSEQPKAGQVAEEEAQSASTSSGLASLIATREALSRKNRRDSAAKPSATETTSATSEQVEGNAQADVNSVVAGESAKPEPSKLEPAKPEPASLLQVADEVQNEQAPKTDLAPKAEPALQLNQAPQLNQADELAGEVRFAAQVDEWSATVERLEVVGRTRQVLLNAYLERSGQGLKLLVAESQRALLSGHMEASLRNELAKVLDVNQLQIELGEPEKTPFLIQQDIDSQRLAAAKQRLDEHPAIQRLQSELSAQISKVSVLH